MAGKIIADTIETGAGADISTSYVVNGSAKAWNNMNGTGTAAIRDSFNIASITDVGTGEYKHTLSSAMSTADNYSLSGFARVSASAGFFGGVDNTTFTSTVIHHATFNSSAASQADALYVTIDVHGDLA
jgi:hypothetical protein